jgi:hypothetical protein
LPLHGHNYNRYLIYGPTNLPLRLKLSPKPNNLLPYRTRSLPHSISYYRTNKGNIVNRLNQSDSLKYYNRNYFSLNHPYHLYDSRIQGDTLSDPRNHSNFSRNISDHPEENTYSPEENIYSTRNLYGTENACNPGTTNLRKNL